MSIDPFDHDIKRRARIWNALAEAQDDLAAWLVAQELGESEETVERLGFALYDKLGTALNIDPNGDGALAIVTMLMISGGPQERAQRTLAGLRLVMTTDNIAEAKGRNG